MTRLTFVAAAGVIALAAGPLAAAAPIAGPQGTQQSPPPVPVPRPFPGTVPPPAPATPATSAPSTPPVKFPEAQAPPAGSVDPYIYPGAEFVDSYDAGQGQRYYLYGTATPFAEVVNHYKSAMKSGGREIFRTPPTHQFDLGRFDEGTMAYPPSIVVKDYTWNNSPGYLHVAGTTEKRFRTIVQIVLPRSTP